MPNTPVLNIHIITESPWGHVQFNDQVADGIIFVSTASHGGFWLSAERLRQLPPAVAAFKTWAGPGWFEEDCDAALVVASFPDHFSQERVECARAWIASDPYFASAREAFTQPAVVMA